MECQKKPEKPLTLGRSGTQYVAMVTQLIIAYCRAHLVKSCCQDSIISDTNWLRYLAFIYLINIWLSVWRHHLANLHILKTWIFLQQKEMFYFSHQPLVYVLKWLKSERHNFGLVVPLFGSTTVKRVFTVKWQKWCAETNTSYITSKVKAWRKI